jgi:primosomal protein N' (replication factor Y)
MSTAAPTPPVHVARAARPRAPARARTPAPELPVARVIVDVGLAHLDRLFDYLVPAEWHEKAVVGSRVRVRFAGRLVDGWVRERVEVSEHLGQLAYLAAAVSAEPVLTPQVAELAEAVAQHWAGSVSDVLRLAIPPRHARVEAADVRPTTATPIDAVVPVGEPEPGGDEGPWSAYESGPALLVALTEGKAPRAVWTALPGRSWADQLAAAVAAAAVAGRGAIVVVPDARDLTVLDAAVTARLGPGRHVCLAADSGPAERYRRWLAVRRGAVNIVLGTRAAAFAPVSNLGLVAIWDDGDDLHVEQHAPYPHTRELLVLRSHLAGAAALIGGHAMTTEAAHLVATGWAKEVSPRRDELRARAPRVIGIGDESGGADPLARAARLPTVGWRAARDALAAGLPVLVQVPRAGYQPGLACGQCREPARCRHCAGPLGRGSGRPGQPGGVPSCRWCGVPAADWTCATCGSGTLRATAVGAIRTAEELGRAFPGVPIRTSSGERILSHVPGGAHVVVATPGAEPAADGGYGVVLLLDARSVLARADLRSGEEAVRRWLNAAALARSAPEGGRVVVTADPALAPVQALIRWDPSGYAVGELAERRSLRFPPTVRMATVTGAPAAIAELVGDLTLPVSEILGPVDVPGEERRERLIVRVPRSDGAALAQALKSALATRSARKAEPVRVQLDPRELF